MADRTDSTVHKSVVVTQLIAICGFIGVPALIMFVAPVTWLTFEKGPAGVTATTRKCMFFVIPFRTEVVTSVTDIGEKLVAARKFNAVERRRGHQGVKVADGTLIISGPTNSVHINVSPSNLAQTAERARTYLKDPRVTPLRMTVVANWTVSVAVGGVATFLAALYVLGATLGVAKWLLETMGWMIRTLGPAGPDSPTDPASATPNSDSIA